MRKNLVWAALVLAGALLQTTVVPSIRLEAAVPDLTLLLVIFFALADGEERAMFTGVLGGVFQDVFGHNVLGHHMLGLVITGYLAGRVARRLMIDHPAVKVALVFVSAVLSGMVFTTVQFVQQPYIGATHLIFSSVVPSAFYSALITPLFFWLLDLAFTRRFRPLTQH